MNSYELNTHSPSDSQQVHQKEYSFNLKIKIDPTILDTSCELFPRDENEKFPRAIKMLFGGKRSFTIYFSNASSGSFDNYINLILASDVDNKQNNSFLRETDNSTISLYGFNQESCFTITKILRVPKLVGSISNRVIKAEVVFCLNNNTNAQGLPEHLFRQIAFLPNSQRETKFVNERITHWDEYLKINEKLAKETQGVLVYSSYRQLDNNTQLAFRIKDEMVSAKQYNSSIQLVVSEEIEENQIGYIGPIIGTITKFDEQNKELLVDLDFDFREILRSGKGQIPNSAKLFISKIGDIVQIRRLRNGLKTLARGQAENPNLEVFLFDAMKAKGFKAPAIKLSKEQLLQSSLNKEQILAVEGALNSQDLFLIQGPPGTGKTTVIAEICYQNAIRNKKTLIASQTNLAVDNALSKLVHHPKIRALRKGNEESVQEEGILFIENNVIQTWLNKTASGCENLINDKMDEIQIVEAAEKRLDGILQEYNIYARAINNQKDNFVKRENVKIEENILNTNLSWFVDGYSRFINSMTEDSYKNITAKVDIVGDSFINAIKTVYDIAIEQKQLQLDYEANVNLFTNEMKKFSKYKYDINVLKRKFIKIDNKSKSNDVSKRKIIIPDEKTFTPKVLTFYDWQREAIAIGKSINSVKRKRPIELLIKLGFGKKWLASVSSLIGRYNKFEACSDATILAEKEKLEVLLSDNRVSEMLKNLKDIYEAIVTGWREKLSRVLQELEQLEMEISQDLKKATAAQIAIREYNISLPYNMVVEGIEQVLLKEDIKKYYLNLWKQKKEDDFKYLALTKEWGKRILKKSENDYTALKNIYIENANVIGITCSQSGSNEFSKQYPVFDVAIIDEVSKATPPELILSVLKAKKIILVGDHKQLPPMIGMETYEEIAKQFGISEDETQHMKKSLFEELFINAPEELKVMLSTQYRMHPQIMDSINQFYIDENERGLSCGISNPDVIKAHNCYGGAIEERNHIMWVDMPLKKEFHEEQSRTNFSYSNKVEVESIKDILRTIAKNLKANNYERQKQIGIISFYSSQVKLLEKELLNSDFSKSIDNISLRIGSVDRFQGIECEVIICSFVRNNPNGEIGFAKDPRRVNVALSRAKELLIIVGCSELFCSRNRSDAATEVYQTVRNAILETGGIRHAADFR